MEKIYDVTALGELLIDFTENGTSAQGNPLLESLEKRPHLSEKSEKICSENS